MKLFTPRNLINVGLLLVLLGVYLRATRVVPYPNMNPKYPVMQIDPKSLDAAKHFIVLISNEGLMGVGRGTGVVIDKNHVLTCAHLSPEAEQEMWIYTYPVGRVLKGKVQYSDIFKDLALIELSSPINLPYYPVFQDKIDEGEPLVVIGNILGSMRWFVTYGTYCGMDGPYILTDALIHGGNSGGPWFNYQGEIVALTDWGLTHGNKETGISGGVSAKTIHQFLQDAKHPDPLMMLFGSLKHAILSN